LIDQLHPSADLTPGQNVPKPMEQDNVWSQIQAGYLAETISALPGRELKDVQPVA